MLINLIDLDLNMQGWLDAEDADVTTSLALTLSDLNPKWCRRSIRLSLILISLFDNRYSTGEIARYFRPFLVHKHLTPIAALS